MRTGNQAFNKSIVSICFCFSAGAILVYDTWDEFSFTELGS
jgi:hypothetical protein